ncbi:MAG: chitobiase/beta-hexosaminidase C-terminal domain-containing protein, partial [Prevotella sp.]|nr:chitobiase/beta-hexosaminidase C-terminal domain-containing protein [Prevotella sp.]
GSSQGSETGGGSNSETVEAPVISGETPFDESTQVSISGHDGAEIRYTTDGTAPNAQSSLYSEAITLSDTTTVKAIAIKNGVSSEAATKVFTKNGSNVGSGGFETGN